MGNSMFWTTGYETNHPPHTQWVEDMVNLFSGIDGMLLLIFTLFVGIPLAIRIIAMVLVWLTKAIFAPKQAKGQHNATYDDNYN